MMEEIDAAWLGALVGGEGYLWYRRVKSKVTTKKKTYVYYYWSLYLEIEMGEEEWVKRAAELFGTSYRKKPDGYWETIATGSRAFKIVARIEPYLLGFKARAAQIIARSGPSLPAREPRPLLPSLKGRNGPGGI